MSWLACLGFLLLWASPHAQADDPTCPSDGGWLDGHAHLRALFLDLRGEVPTPEQYEELLVEGEVPASLVDQLLRSPRFTDRAVRFHRSLFWNDVSNVRLLPPQSLISPRGGSDVYYVPRRADVFRGANTFCGDGEARYDEDGQLITIPSPNGGRAEGWVLVEPYWAPGTELRVCAYDAQEQAVSPTGTDCSTRRAYVDAGCGCGPNLRWCAPPSEEAVLAESFGEAVDQRVGRMLDADASWLALLTGTRGIVNGPMADFYRHRSDLPRGLQFDDLAVAPEALPELGWSQRDTWVEVELGDQHAGVLTSPAYLLRFTTGRARANQFHQSFLCEPFQPPTGGLTALNDPNPTLDLTQRTGCNYCHALLEPAAAHWGRWTEFGAGYLSPEDYAIYDATCAECAAGGVDCPDYCEEHYLVRTLSSEQDPYVGQLMAYQFLEERHFANVEQGPRRLVNQGDVDGRLPRCAAKKTAEWLLGRDLESADEPWLEELATSFATGGYRWRALVREIVLSDSYRSVR